MATDMDGESLSLCENHFRRLGEMKMPRQPLTPEEAKAYLTMPYDDLWQFICKTRQKRVRILYLEQGSSLKVFAEMVSAGIVPQDARFDVTLIEGFPRICMNIYHPSFEVVAEGGVKPEIVLPGREPYQPTAKEMDERHMREMMDRAEEEYNSRPWWKKLFAQIQRCFST